jgi:predicted metalloprotease with PDZ domain
MQQGSSAITYTLLGFDPATHRAQFSLAVPLREGEAEVEIVLPLWAPGAYEIRESAREVREVTARRPADGTPLPVERRAKNRWKVAAPAEPAIEFRYVVYGHDLSDDGFDVTDEHIYLNATRCLPWVEGRSHEPVELALHLPAGWKAFAELPRLAESPVRYRARDYEELVDTPVDCGTPVELELRAGGIPHRLLVCGGPGNFEAHRLEEDVRRIVEAQIRFFGGSPLASYTFFVHLSDRRGGGLEHRASTSIVVERTTFRPAESYDRFLTVVSHEYFHLYNVKRIRPRALGPFDLTREVYTRQLWWMEGTTDYAAHLLVRRAGLFTPSKYLGQVAELARKYLRVPGRAVRSLEEGSFCAWIDLYRPYEETRNQSVSYYLKGYLVSLALDLEIRHRTDDRVRLDDVFRRLWGDHARSGRGLEEEELFAVISSVAGSDLGGFFDRYIRGTAELDLDAFARYAGLRFGPAPKPPDPADAATPVDLGIETAPNGERIRIKEVLDGTSGRRAGLTPGDEIVGFDGVRVVATELAGALQRYVPGDVVTVDLFRRGVLRHVRVEAAPAPPAKYAFTPDPTADEGARRIYASWLDAPWEPPPPATPPSAP